MTENLHFQNRVQYTVCMCVSRFIHISGCGCFACDQLSTVNTIIFYLLSIILLFSIFWLYYFFLPTSNEKILYIMHYNLIIILCVLHCFLNQLYLFVLQPFPLQHTFSLLVTSCDLLCIDWFSKGPGIFIF